MGYIQFIIIFTFSSSTILNLNPRTVIPFSWVRASWTVSSWIFRWTRCNSSGYLEYWIQYNCLMECVFEQNCFCQGKTWRPKCWGKYPILGYCCCGCFGLLSAIQVQSGHNIAWNSFSIYSFIKSWNLFPWKNRNKKLKSTYIWISEIYERKIYVILLDSINAVLRPMVVLVVYIPPVVEFLNCWIRSNDLRHVSDIFVELFNSIKRFKINLKHIYQWN